MNNSEKALIAGAILALIGNIINTLLTRRSEDKIKFRETLFKTALEHRAQDYKFHIESIRPDEVRTDNDDNEVTPVIAPLEVYLKYAVTCCEGIPHAKITVEDFEKIMEKLEKVMNDHIKKLEAGK